MSNFKKNDFPKVSKNLAMDTDLKIILLNYQNNYTERSSITNNIAKNFIAINLSILHEGVPKQNVEYFPNF